MDRRRSDTAGQLLEPVPTPASTTTAQLAKRFTATQLAGIENGIGVVNARVLGVVSARRRTQLLTTATIDGDTTDVEVYGTKKQDAVYNYQGQRAYRPHIAFWADGGVTLAADLMKADEDPRPVAAELWSGHLPLTTRAKKSLENSVHEAAAMHDRHIGVEHLALGLITMNGGLVAPILLALGASEPALRAAILDRYRQAS